MKRVIFAIVAFALLVVFTGEASAQDVRPASWDIVVSGSPDISIPLFSLEKSNGPTTKVVTPGSSYEVTILRDLGGDRSEFGVMFGVENFAGKGWSTAQAHWFNPFVTKGAFQLGTTVGAGLGANRDGFRFGSPGMAFHGDLTAAVKSQHGVVKIGAGLDSRKILAVRVSAGVGF